MNLVLLSLSVRFGSVLHAVWNQAAHLDRYAVGEVVGAMLVLLAAFRWIRKRSIKWMPLTARVTGCRVTAVPSGIIKARKLAYIHYDLEYEVEGTPYVSAHSVLENKEVFFEARRHARSIVNHGVLQIYYDAHHPKMSVLTLPKFRPERWMAVAGLALAMFCLAMGKLHAPKTGFIPLRESATSGAGGHGPRAMPPVLG